MSNVNKNIKRAIRLKEFGSNVFREMIPEDAYLAKTNGTIKKEKFILNTNSNGFIVDPDIPEFDSTPVYVFGDSFVESVYVQQGKRFCDILSKSKSFRKQTNFYNAGYSGATSLHVLNSLIARLPANKSASVLHILPSNDVLSLFNSEGFWNFADKRYSPIQPIPRRMPVNPGDFKENLVQLSRVLESIIKVATSFKFKVFFATTPYIQTDYHSLAWYKSRNYSTISYEFIIECRQAANHVMREVAKKHRVILLDLEDEMLDNSMFYDDVHLNEKGSVAVAKIIEEGVAKYI